MARFRSRMSLATILVVGLTASYLAYSYSPLFSSPPSEDKTNINGSSLGGDSLTQTTPFCYGSSIIICSFPGQFDLARAVGLLQYQVELHHSVLPPDLSTHDAPLVACTEIAYPGLEKVVLQESHRRGTFICLFNSKYAMNMALNRMSTFIEDFTTVDSHPDYTDEKWSRSQKSEGTLGHNLESPDITRYIEQTRSLIVKRASSKDPGTRLESEFLQTYIVPKIDPKHGKPDSIFLGVYIPSKKSSAQSEEILKSVIGHEIFHSMYFHSKKMRSIVENFVAKMSPEEKNLLEKKLSQKGHAVTNENGDRPTSKQTYMLHNEAQAYLLESGSCVDGAFMSYEDDEATSPDRVIPKTAPLVVKYSAKLRKELIDAGVFAREWADHWSPDVVRNKGCKG